MAGNRYGEGRGWQDRGSSIFSDDDDDRWGRGDADRWSSDYGRERGGGATGRWSENRERGIFDRVGDEVRSWFGDDEAERRRDRDVREPQGAASERPSSYRSNSAAAGSFAPPRPGREEGAPRSRYDANYLRWREQQMRRFDEEYEEYCRDCQQQFESDFDSWRSSRLTSGGTSATSAQESPPATSEIAAAGTAEASGSTPESSSRGRSRS